MSRETFLRLFCAASVILLAACACAPPGVARAAKPVLDEPPREAPFPREVAASVKISDGGCQLDVPGASSGAWAPDFDVRGDPDFHPSTLPESVRCWYETLWKVLTDPGRSNYFTSRAARGDLYTYAREVNNHIVALLTAFRVTGDLALLDEVSRLTQHMRAQLDDSWKHGAAVAAGSVDGYLNWVWDQDYSDTHRGRDINEIDEMRVHSVLAQVAWVFEENSGLKSPNGVDYNERSQFWLDYLRNHFEAKWRERNDVPWPEFPFLGQPHLHETLEFARYHHYMYLLTGEEPYEEEAQNLSRIAYENFREVDTESGTALVTPRSVLSLGGLQEYLIPSTYFRLVVATAVDLHFAGVAPWDDETVMNQLARSLAVFILDEEGNGFARDVGGGHERAGIRPSVAEDWSRMAASVFNISAFPLLAAWDDTGEVAQTSVSVHLGRGEREWSVYVPTGMLLDAAMNAIAVAASDD